MPVSCFTPGNEDIVGDCLCKFFFILRFLFHIFFSLLLPEDQFEFEVEKSYCATFALMALKYIIDNYVMDN